MTSRLQAPVLQTVTTRSARVQHGTPPKFAEPVTVKVPAAAVPRTVILRSPPGSLLETLSVADFAPRLVGAKRIGSGRAVPGAMMSGYERTSGTRKSVSEEVMLATERGHFPPLLRTRGSSLNAPTHTGPKSPVSAIARSSRGVTASPDTSTTCGLDGSLLTMVILPDFAPALPGWNRIVTSIELPTLTINGKALTLGTRKSADDEVMVVIVRRPKPLLLMVSVSPTGEFTQALPNCPSWAIAVATRGRCARAAKNRFALRLPQPVQASQPLI